MSRSGHLAGMVQPYPQRLFDYPFWDEWLEGEELSPDLDPVRVACATASYTARLCESVEEYLARMRRERATGSGTST